MIVKNPIITGFNPDPSILRVGDDYYIANSTFEWFPGVQIHHSKDLVNWKLINRPLNRLSQLDMRGVPDSCGVWAPCLSYHDTTFYLVYSVVRNFDGPFKDTPNFVVTTKNIKGDWSEPVFLSSSGFDGSMYHDDDGRHWYLSMVVDHRVGKFFGGISIQEYNAKVGQLVGQSKLIFEGSELGKTEGPHIYKRNGYYYLLTAEGGTEYEHAISIARSTNLMGPYELHPDNPIITAAHVPSHSLQKNGHGDLVETIDGRWYCVYLTGRPLSIHGRCILGRETAISEMEWRDDDWIYSMNQKVSPIEIEIPIHNKGPKDNLSFLDNFDGQHLNKHFQSLRVPITSDWASLDERLGYIRLYGRDSLSSYFDQSLIARRLQHFAVEVTTHLEFNPKCFQQMAGLICFYNTYHWHYLHISVNESGQRVLHILTCDKYELHDHLGKGHTLKNVGGISLKASIDHKKLKFSYSTDSNIWQRIGLTLDMSILSDDYVQDTHNRYRAAFTGSFVGICCQDLTGARLHADFDWFEYQEK